MLKIRDSQIQPASCGDGVVIVKPSNIYGCHLESGVFVGPFCEIQANVRIGAKTRIQSHSFVCELVDIGAFCFIGHGVMFVNDLMRNGPARGNQRLWMKTKIGNHVSIGSNSTVLPVSICDGVIIGAGSVVTRDISEPGTYAGNPARKLAS